MKRLHIYYKIVCLFALGLIVSGCGKEAKPIEGLSFSLESYDDFLWEQQEPDTIKVALNTEFSECDGFRKSLKLALCDYNGKVVPASDVSVFVDGVLIDRNVIEIPVVEGKHETEIGLVINRSLLMETKVYDWYLKVYDTAGLDKVLYEYEGAVCEVSPEDSWVFGTQISVDNSHVSNPLALGTGWSVAIMLAVLLLIYLIARAKNPSVKFTYIKIDTGAGESKYSTQGCYRVVLTNNSNLKFGFWHWLSNGKVAVIYNEFWTSDVTIKKGRGANLTILTMGEYVLPDEPLRREEFVIKNANGQKATLITN